MKYILYGIIFLLTICELIVTNNSIISSNDIPLYKNLIVLILIIIILILIKEKFYNNNFFSIFTYITISIIVYYNYSLYILLGLIFLDIAYKKNIYLEIIFLFLPLYLIINNTNIVLLIVLIFTNVLGYILIKKNDEHNFFIKSLDNERKLRYELENVKLQLIQNSHEIERLTEIKERNRIAREIHDNIGHDVAGVLFQLQAAEKIVNNDTYKANNIISLCIEKLSDSLKMIHDTVYNIKPNNEIDENIFKSIIDKFLFCPISFNLDGNINDISSEKLEILIVNLKESLTNASKYSGATQIDIKIEVTKKYIRYHYKDNGKGCILIKEGLGISGMKERVKNYGGFVNIDGNDGFSIICIIPNQKTNIFE